MKHFSLVTEILGGPQAETVKARKEEQGVNIDYPKFAPQFYLRGQSSSICKVKRTRQEATGHCRNF